MKYTAVVQGERLEIEFERKSDGMLQARIGENSYTLESRTVEPGIYWFNLDNRSFEIAVTANGEAYSVSVANRPIDIEILDSRAALRKAAQQGHDGVAEIRAPMPGKIVKILAAEGSEVQANQGILVMEAMKMQNEIKSPKQGVLKRLSVQEGAAVSSGDLLAAVE